LPGFAGCLGSSLGSCSISAHSVSCAGSYRSSGHSSSILPAVEQGSSSGHWFIGKDKIAPALQMRLVEELNINSNYTNHSARGLCFAWAQYLECTAALAQAKEMVEAGSWPSDIPPFTEWLVIEVFIGRSTWYANYVPAFGAIADKETDFPEMRDWLDSPPEQVHQADAEHLWGIQNQSSFTMEDIKKWQDDGGTLDKHYNPSPSPEQTFGPNISLATMLLLLFTMTENPELLSLHACQQHPAEGENKTVASGWIHSLSCAIMHRLKDDIKTVFHPGEYWSRQNHQVTKLSIKLDAFANLLNLTPYDHQGKFKERL